MIVKHVPMRSAKQSDFAGLVKYITSTQGKTERLGTIQTTNCEAGKIDAVIAEVLATQRQNTRARGDKTYHLLVSFAPGETPAEAVLKDIENRICDGLGFSGHQRLSCVHHDTDNTHIHIAINKIHPTRGTMHEPFLAYKKIGELCTILEAEHGLQSVNHKKKRGISEGRATDMEKHSGIESLVSWIKSKCLSDLIESVSWKDLHRNMAENGLKIKLRGNGLVVQALDGTTVKASTLSRDLSKKNLESRFGLFTPPAEEETPTKSRRAYKKRPLPMRIDTTELYEQYQQQWREDSYERSIEWAELLGRKKNLIEAAKRSNRLRRAAIKLVGGDRLTKRILYAQAHKAYRSKLQSIQNQYQIDKRRTYTNRKKLVWVDWLRKQALAGDDRALKALRAREMSRGLQENTLSAPPATIVSPNSANKPLIKLDGVTKKGTLIYSTKGLCTIRDNGDKIKIMRAAFPEGYATALRYAIQCYEDRIEVNGTSLFKSKIVAAAVASGIPVTFADVALEAQHQHLKKIKEDRFGQRKPDNRGAVDRRGHGVFGTGSAVQPASRTPEQRIDPRSGDLKPDIGSVGSLPPPQSRNRLRTLSMLDLVRFAGGAKMLLPRNVPGHVEQQGTEPDRPLRRDQLKFAITTDQFKAAAEYISERENKRTNGFADIPKHLLCSSGGGYFYAGQRKIDECNLILLKSEDKMFVLPTDPSTAARLKRKQLGTPVAVAESGRIKSKSKGRNQ